MTVSETFHILTDVCLLRFQTTNIKFIVVLMVICFALRYTVAPCDRQCLRKTLQLLAMIALVFRY